MNKNNFVFNNNDDVPYDIGKYCWYMQRINLPDNDWEIVPQLGFLTRYIGECTVVGYDMYTGEFIEMYGNEVIEEIEEGPELTYLLQEMEKSQTVVFLPGNVIDNFEESISTLY